jgi:hypothetical protein
MTLAYDSGSIPNVTFGTAVPEPSALVLLVLGLAGLAAYGRKRPA